MVGQAKRWTLLLSLTTFCFNTLFFDFLLYLLSVNKISSQHKPEPTDLDALDLILPHLANSDKNIVYANKAAQEFHCVLLSGSVVGYKAC